MLLLVVFGYLAVQPRVRRDGWPSIIPTTGLLLIAWSFDLEDDHAWGAALGEELVERVYHATRADSAEYRPLANWQWRLAMRAVVRHGNMVALEQGPNQALAHDCYGIMAMLAIECGAVEAAGMHDEFHRWFPVHVQLTAPARWPQGQVIYCTSEIVPTAAMGYFYHAIVVDCVDEQGNRVDCYEPERYMRTHHHISDDMIALDPGGRTGLHRLTVRFDIFGPGPLGEHEKQTLHAGTATIVLSIDLSGVVNDYVDPIVGTDADQKIRRSLSLEGSCSSDGATTISVYAGRIGDSDAALVPYFTPRVELVHDGRTLAAAARILDCDMWPRDCWNELHLNVGLSPPLTQGQWFLRIQGDPMLCLREGCTGRYWAGIIEYPITWEWDSLARLWRMVLPIEPPPPPAKPIERQF